ncbi:MAG: CRTAC1 family protein [Phycisphaerales bacterium]|nr:CRTAC1 family protein [Phycisphaerales bacterium]
MRHASRACFVVFVSAINQGVFVFQLSAAPPVLSDQTQAVGLDTPHARVFLGPDMEFMAAGGAAGDFDNDGDQDLFILGGSASVDHLYINDGTGHFIDKGAFAGIDRTHQGSGVAVGDYDNDGDLDVFVTSFGPPDKREPGWNVLWSNNGDGTFTDVTAIAGVSTTNPFVADSFGASFCDYDLDGDLDLAVAGWLGGGKVFLNNGDGTFTDVTTTAINSSMTGNRGFSPRFVDMDGDLYPELLWVADFYTSKYFVNNTDGTFSDQTLSAGTGFDSNGMGNTYGDYNNDGYFDWYVSSRITHDTLNGSGNMLYLGSQVDHVYNEISIETGTNFGYWGWGVVSVDINHDGALDIFETNGFEGNYTNDPSILYLNDGTGHFSDAAAASGINDSAQGRGVISADFDLDGDQDIIVLNNGSTMVYYRNDLVGDDTNAITLEFDTSAFDELAPNGFGTRVWFDSKSHNQLRYLDGGTAFLSQSELSVHAGLGADTNASITVQWSNGDVDVFPAVAPGRYTIRALACPADLTLDGTLSFFDIAEFLNLFTQQHPQGDFSRDGLFDFFDVSAFLTAYTSGCSN